MQFIAHHSLNTALKANDDKPFLLKRKKHLMVMFERKTVLLTGLKTRSAQTVQT
jgi:hypothetical protein